MVGAAGFEPATLCSQSRCATRLRHAPRVLTAGILFGRAASANRAAPSLEPPEEARARIRVPAQPWELRVTAKILDGKAVAQQIRDELETPRRARPRAARPPAGARRSCSSATIRPRRSMSATSSRRPKKPGMGVHLERLPATATLAATLAAVRRFNEDPRFDGILVQSPLPKAMGADAEQQVFDTIDPEQRRRRLQPDFGGPSGAESRRVRAVHARGRHRAARPARRSRSRASTRS